MSGAITSTEQDLVSCEMCLREVPRSEAAVPEATDYVLYFCGLECYQKWKDQQPERPEAPTIERE